MITKLELKNFTTFEKLDIDFSPRINVIIGENGTGKTQLLKASYALSHTSKIDSEDIETTFTKRLVDIFMPLDDKLGKMRKNGATENASMKITFDKDETFKCSFHTNSQKIAVQDNQNYLEYKKEPVYIPTKEVLSFMKGFTSLYAKYDLSFDETYLDICTLLDLPEMKAERLNPKAKWAMDEIEKICKGKFVFYGGGKVTFKTSDAEYSANSMAEGFRKAGMLSRLLETGAIEPGVSGTLFWDEPETNMNPKLMRLFVEIMLELSRNGQQIVIATHDYVLLKWFDLLRDEGKSDEIKYHSLYLEENEIKRNSTLIFDEIYPNPIDEAFGFLVDQEISNDMGDLGK